MQSCFGWLCLICKNNVVHRRGFLRVCWVQGEYLDLAARFGPILNRSIGKHVIGRACYKRSTIILPLGLLRQGFWVVFSVVLHELVHCVGVKRIDKFLDRQQHKVS